MNRRDCLTSLIAFLMAPFAPKRKSNLIAKDHHTGISRRFVQQHFNIQTDTLPKQCFMDPADLTRFIIKPLSEAKQPEQSEAQEGPSQTF